MAHGMEKFHEAFRFSRGRKPQVKKEADGPATFEEFMDNMKENPPFGTETVHGCIDLHRGGRYCTVFVDTTADKSEGPRVLLRLLEKFNGTIKVRNKFNYSIPLLSKFMVASAAWLASHKDRLTDNDKECMEDAAMRLCESLGIDWVVEKSS